MDQNNSSPTPKRVAFVLPWMGGGGIERLTLALMRGFLEQGVQIDLVLTEEGGNFMHLVPPQAHTELFGCARVRHAIPRLREYMKRRQPDAMIVSVWPLTAAVMLAAMGLQHKPRLILSDHNHLTSQYSSNTKAWAMVKATLKLLYPRADALVGVSEGVADNVAQIAALPRSRVTAIYNPIPAPDITVFPQPHTDALWGHHTGPRIIAVGRFKKQKNHALLMRAFARIQQQTNARLVLLGEGELEEELLSLRAELAMQDHIAMPGFQVDPSPWYASANLFVLSSDYEGFGNVLVEAMHFGLPIVSTDCPSGPAEILDNGTFGRLVPVGDSERLAEAMMAELSNPTPADTLKARALDFSIQAATQAYARLALPGHEPVAPSPATGGSLG